MMKKSFYETPEAELLLVKFEENFCNSPLNPGGVPQVDPNDIDGEY